MPDAIMDARAGGANVKAAVYDRYGPPEVLRIEEVERPVPGDDEVLVGIHATTVNRTDTGFRGAEYFLSRFYTGLRRPRRRILGSEFASRRTRDRGLQHEERRDRDLARSRRGHRLRARGLHEERPELRRDLRLGRQALVQEVARLAEVGWDLPGHRRVRELSARAVDVEGRRQARRVGHPAAYRKQDVVFFKELIEAGEYRPVIDRTYPLEDVVEASRYVETGQKTGNVVLTVATDA